MTTSAVAPIFTADEAAASPAVDDPATGGATDLSMAEQLPAGAGGGIEHPDLSLAEELPSASGGGADADKRKSTYALLAVTGAALPSASSKFVGATPKAAMMKAARRIHKRSDKTHFAVLMRRVSSRKVDKKLYKYAVVMKKRSRPTGFVTLVDPRFVVEKTTVKKGATTKTAGDISMNVDKKVPIVAASEHPAYGWVDASGKLKKGASVDAEFVVVRAPGTDTLYLVVPGDIPDSINGLEVVKTDWDVATIEEVALTDAERSVYDIATAAKDANDETARARSDAAKRSAERKREIEREAKAKAKAAKVAGRDKERAKREAAKAKAADQKAKERAKKDAAKAKAAAKKK